MRSFRNSVLANLPSCDAVDRALEVYRRGDTQLAISKALGRAVSRLKPEEPYGSPGGRAPCRCCRRYGATPCKCCRRYEAKDQRTLIGCYCRCARIYLQLEEGNAVHEKVTASLRKELETQKGEFEYSIGQMQASTSWKVTKPIRKLGAFRKRLILSIQKNTTRFRLRSIHKYQRMSVRHPHVAWISRVAVRPFFRIIKQIYC